MRAKDRCIPKSLSAFFTIITTISALWIAPFALAQDKANTPDAISSAEPVSIEAYSSRDKIAPGDRLFLALKVTVGAGWHINSNRPGEEFLIPTEVSLGEDAPVTVENLIYPEAKSKRFAFSPEAPLSIFDGTVWIKVILLINKDATAGLISIPVQIITQACDDRSCVAPTTQTFSIPIEIAPGVTVSEASSR